MSKIKTVEEIFESENLDANAITITGIPERHLKAVLAIAKLFVVVDHHNPNFQPDYSDYSQDKFEPIFEPGSPSGSRFAFYDHDGWGTHSTVGSRLVSESITKTRLIAENYPDLYKDFMVYERELKK
jgi:hypothetical protein